MQESATEPPFAGSRLAEVFANPALGARRLELHGPTSVYEPETPADSLYLIESGQVRISQIGPDQSQRLIDILGPEDWFGIAALAREPTYGTRATAIGSTTLWVLPAERVMHLLSEQPQVAVELVAQLAGRLQAANEAASRLVFDDCNQRLIQTLLRFSHTSAATPQEGGEVVLRITHQQLAQAVGAARETVSLALTQLRQRSLLRTGRNRLFFNPHTLEQFSQRQAEISRRRGGAAGAAP